MNMAIDGEVRGVGMMPYGGGFAVSLAEMESRLEALDKFRARIMKDGTDYDVLPGTDKPTLLKPGAEKLLLAFGLVPYFPPGGVEAIADYATGYFSFRIECQARIRGTSEVVANAFGSCNSKEPKYRYRIDRPKCPSCQRDLFRSKQAPEWFCWRAKGGCGVTVGFDRIPENSAKRVENTEPYDLINTLDKMAQKRALVAVALIATATSGAFNQDLDEIRENESARDEASTGTDQEPRRPAPAQQSRPRSAQAPARASVTMPEREDDRAQTATPRMQWEALSALAETRGVRLASSNPPAEAKDAMIRKIVAVAAQQLGVTPALAVTWHMALEVTSQERSSDDHQAHTEPEDMPPVTTTDEVPF